MLQFRSSCVEEVRRELEETIRIIERKKMNVMIYEGLLIIKIIILMTLNDKRMILN